MKRIGIVGAGRFGAALVEDLARRGAEIVMLDRDHDAVQRVSSFVQHIAEGDASDMSALKEIGFADCDTAVVAIGTNVEGSSLAVMNLKELNIPYIVAKAGSDLHGKVLERLGVDLVVYPDKERAARLARSLMAKTALDYFEISEDVSVLEMIAPTEWTGKTLAEAGIRQDHGLTVLSIQHAADERGKRGRIIIPSADDVVREGDTLLIFGPNDKLDAIS